MKSNKKQGNPVKDGHKADTNTKIKSVLPDRGTGSAFAYALANVLEQSKQLKGTQNGFLGVESEVLSVKEFIDSK